MSASYTKYFCMEKHHDGPHYLTCKNETKKDIICNLRVFHTFDVHLSTITSVHETIVNLSYCVCHVICGNWTLI